MNAVTGHLERRNIVPVNYSINQYILIDCVRK